MFGWSRSIGLVLASIAALGCLVSQADGGSGIDDDYMDDPPPPGGCAATGCSSPGSDGSPLGGPCLDSDDCAENGVCAAVFDGQVQGFTCSDRCIPPMDDTQWCADDRSCCPGTSCSSRGFCLAPGESEGLDDGSSTHASSTHGTGTTGGSEGDATGTTMGSTTGSATETDSGTNQSTG